MTADKDFKRLVRARAARTGESYSSALRHFRVPPTQTRGANHEEKPPVNIVRAIPDVRSHDLEASREFYADLLGFEVCMEQGKMLMFCSPTHTLAQVTINGDEVALPPGFSVDVDTPGQVDVIHEQAVGRGLTIIEPVSDKPWGIRRFSMLDPNGARVTVLAHLAPEHQGR